MQRLLLSLSEKVISEYTNELNDVRKKGLFGYDPNKNVSNNVLDLEIIDDEIVFNEIVSKSGKKKYQWWGFVYEWEDTWTSLTMTGKTTRPHPMRKKKYIDLAVFNKNSRRYTKPHLKLHYDSLNIDKEAFNKVLSGRVKGGLRIEGLIYNHLKTQGVLQKTVSGKLDYKNFNWKAIKKSVNKRFKFKILKLAFTDSSLHSTEKNRIKQQWCKGIGLNKKLDAPGPLSSNTIFDDVIRMIAIGLNEIQIFRLLKLRGFKGELDTIRKLIRFNFGGMHKAQRKLLNPVIYEFFAIKNYKRYLIDVFKYFERGFNIYKIAEFSGLKTIFGDAKEVVKILIIRKYSERYKDWKLYSDLRKFVFRDLFTEQIKKGITDYAVLRAKFDGFDRPQARSHSERNGKLVEYFFKVFNGISLKDIAIDLLKKELYQKALELIRRKVKIENVKRYNGGQLLLDLDFGIILPHYAEESIRKNSGRLLREYLGYNFNELRVHALKLQDKAIDLINKNLNNLYNVGKREGYSRSDLALDLGFTGYGYSEQVVGDKASLFIKRYTGYSWEQLINIVKNN